MKQTKNLQRKKLFIGGPIVAPLAKTTLIKKIGITLEFIFWKTFCVEI